MISLIEALNYRCLHYIKQPLGQFHVLVGANASGKTTFLDVLGFLGDLVSEGLETAVERRTQNFQDLVYRRAGKGFELAIEVLIPEEKRKLIFSSNLDTVRYEVSIGINSDNEISIFSEKCILKKSNNLPQMPKTLFPHLLETPDTIMTSRAKKDGRTVINKNMGGNDNYTNEVELKPSGSWKLSVKLGSRKSALANLPADESKYPVSTWLKKFLAEGVQKLILNSLVIRKASKPGQTRYFKPDGSNLPWMIDQLKYQKDQFKTWIKHLQTALPDIENIKIIEREDDKHKYLVISYRDELEVPSWMASDGTLRLLALTLPAYLPDFRGVYLVEEPENGIHPRAVETVYQSLSSIYNGQILLATHSPVILSMSKAKEVLCFAKTVEGATDIVSGDNHPALQNWKGGINLGTLYAGGVLG